MNKSFPFFYIKYNKRYNRFVGEEAPINNYPNNNIYKLSGVNEFIIDFLELYEIKI